MTLPTNHNTPKFRCMAIVQQFQIQTSSCGKSCHPLHHLGLKPKIHRKKRFNGLSRTPIDDCRIHHRLRIVWALPTLLDGVLEFGIAENLSIGQLSLILDFFEFATIITTLPVRMDRIHFRPAEPNPLIFSSHRHYYRDTSHQVQFSQTHLASLRNCQSF
jgi:hypothetical protein